MIIFYWMSHRGNDTLFGSVDKEARKMKAADMMGRFQAGIKDTVQGVHLMPSGWADIVPKILQTARIAI